jgi:hypothetical protein
MGAHGRYVFGSNVLGTGQIGGGGQSTRLGCTARGLTHTVSPTVLMSALGQKQTSNRSIAMSALPPKDGVIGRRACGYLKILGAALQADGEYGVMVEDALPLRMTFRE